MYKPAYTQTEDTHMALRLIREFPLGLIISQSDQGLEANYLPFVLQENESERYLITHLARANPQWKQINGDVLISFQGPERYISPTWYESQMEVPTWNFAAVQIQGRVELLQEGRQINEVLHESVRFFEKRNGTTWAYDLPASFRDRLESAIVGMKIHIQKIDVKFKLSQNRAPEDRQNVLRHLEKSSNACDLELFKWMKAASMICSKD
jgi:transcriptional regulator